MKTPKQNAGDRPANSFRFNLFGLIAFSLCLICGTAFFTSKLLSRRHRPQSFARRVIPDADQQDEHIYTRQGPWGELLIQNMELERPAEYIAAEVKYVRPPTWTFAGMGVAEVKALLLANGLSPAEVAQALAPGAVSAQGTNTLIRPSAQFVLALSAQTRQKLYDGLSGHGVNMYIDAPLVFLGNRIESIYADPRLHPDDVALVRKLVYRSGQGVRFSDFETLLCQIPTTERQITMTQVLSRQLAELVRLCIRPDTDIDKIASYWGNMPNVRFTNVRPLLQALKGLPRGGTVSLLHLLPPFARERLYTFPTPDPTARPVDCHWSTFNFSNENPDGRFADPAFNARYLTENYYEIAKPTIYGDLVVFWNDRGQIVHSAVYLAEDLVFTKNGTRFQQPWMIMRISDLQSTYRNVDVRFLRKKCS
jgi:hypothetical protein